MSANRSLEGQYGARFFSGRIADWVRGYSLPGLIIGTVLVALMAVGCGGHEVTSTPSPTKTPAPTANPTAIATTVPTATLATAPGGEATPTSADFVAERSSEGTISQPRRMVPITAPIESVKVFSLGGFPPRYSLQVVSGLPNGCTTFGSYNMTRDGRIVRVEVVNLEPVDKGIQCTEEYRTVSTGIPLGVDFAFGETYAMVVSGTLPVYLIPTQADTEQDLALPPC